MNIFDKLCLLALIFFYFVPCRLLAEQPDLLELDLEQLMAVEVVSSASRYEQKATEAPSSVTVITRDQIQKFGYRSMAELIQSVRGFYSTSDRNYNYTGVRGFGRPSDYDTRLLVLINGHRLNDSVYASALLGFDFIVDIDLIERVEIVRGPSSSVYGTNALFGVINVITRSPESIDGAEVSTDIAQYDTYQGRATYGKKYENGMEVLFSTTRFDSEGDSHLFFSEFDDPETSSGVARNLDGEDGYSAFARVSWDDFTFESAYVDRYKDVPTAAFGTVFNDPEFRTLDSRFYLDLNYKHEFNQSNQVEARLYYDWYEYFGYYPYDYSEEGDQNPFLVTNRDFARGERYGLQAQVVNTSFNNNKALFGFELRDEFNIDQQNYDADPLFRYLDSSEDDSLWAVFLQNDYQAFDWLSLSLGLRFDDFDSVGSEWSPRAGIILTPAEDISLKLLYGRAFRAPNAFELYYQDGETQKQSEDLSPEIIDTYEIVLEYYMNESTRLILNSYYYEVDDLVEVTIDSTDDLLIFRNLDSVTAYGFEGELEKRFRDGWSIRSSYSYQDTENDTTNFRLSNSPAQLWKTHIVAPLIEEKLFIAAELLFIDSRKTFDMQPIDAAWVTNLTLSSRNIVESLDLSASLFNLFDEDYGDPGSAQHVQRQIPASGMTWRFQATYRFGGT